MHVNSNLKQAGFSLIELMVVVAIIGLLAAIAVPQFTKFQNRAKTSEAQTHLAGIYTGEQAFIAQWGAAYGALDSVGYAVASASTRYNCGFTGVGTLPNGASAGTAFDFVTAGVGAYKGSCVGGTKPCAAPADSKALAAVAAPTTTPANTTVFKAGCSGAFNTGAQADYWNIDNNQLVSNTQSGL